jgi:hypothetical protein
MSHYPLPWAVDALRSPSELEDVGWFVPEIALAPQPLRHRREVGSRNTNHRHLVFVKRQTTSSERFAGCSHDRPNAFGGGAKRVIEQVAVALRCVRLGVAEQRTDHWQRQPRARQH